MQVSFWFSVDEKLPNQSGIYFACLISRPFSPEKIIPGFYWWDYDKKSWLSGDKALTDLDIKYWTFADPYLWYKSDYPGLRTLQSFTAAQAAALQEIFDATERFNLISMLSEK